MHHQDIQNWFLKWKHQKSQGLAGTEGRLATSLPKNAALAPGVPFQASCQPAARNSDERNKNVSRKQPKTKYLLLILFSIQHHAVVQHSRLGGDHQDVWDAGQAQHSAGVVAVVVFCRRVHGQRAKQLAQAPHAGIKMCSQHSQHKVWKQSSPQPPVGVFWTITIK